MLPSIGKDREPFASSLPARRTPPWYKGTAPAVGAKVAADLTKRLAARPDVVIVTLALPDDGRPQVRLGCAGDSEIRKDLGEACDAKRRALNVATTQSSKTWRAAFRSVFAPVEAGHLLLLDLAVRDHWLAQKGMSFRKEVPLGTGYAQPAPWLTGR